METKELIGVAGNFDSKLRGDCKIQIELRSSGGVQIEINSKVKAFFKNSINKLVHDIIEFFSIGNAKITVWDSGALYYVIAARIEAAIKKVIDSDKEFLLDAIPENNDQSIRDRFRFSRLYLPGNTPYMMINAGLHKPDGIILDLEDAVAHNKKLEARYVVRNALRSQNFYGAERMVRINQGDFGVEDLQFIVSHNVHLILVPKVEKADDVIKVVKEINRLKEKYHIKQDILLMPIIESALGVENAFKIATSSNNIVAMAIGLEDFTADIGVQRTYEGWESIYARTRIVNACHAAKIQPIDSVFSDVADMKALANNVQKSKALGFRGMGCIHPRQIKIIHENFAPDEVEIEKAKRIVDAFYKAEEKGLGVVSLGTKMIDPPVVKRQVKILDLAVRLGKLSKNWRESYEA